jgi:phage major head subunit gpT-like protein
MLITPENLQKIFTGLNTRFQAGFKASTPWWNQLAMQIDSTTAIETYAWLAALPKMREWLGERVVNLLTGREAQVKNRKFEHTVGIPREKIEDDQIGFYGNWAEGMGQQAAKLPDDLLLEILAAAKTTTTWDGQYFFDTDHPVNVDKPALGTQSNLHTAKPLNPDNWAAIRALGAQLKGEDGRPLGVMYNAIMCGADLEKSAKEIVEAETVVQTIVQGGNNRGGAPKTNVMRGTGKVIVVPELSEAGVWFPLDLSRPVKPFVWQKRTEPEFTRRFSLTDENVFTKDEFEVGARARGAGAYGLWFLAARCEPT